MHVCHGHKFFPVKMQKLSVKKIRQLSYSASNFIKKILDNYVFAKQFTNCHFTHSMLSPVASTAPTTAQYLAVRSAAALFPRLKTKKCWRSANNFDIHTSTIRV